MGYRGIFNDYKDRDGVHHRIGKDLVEFARRLRYTRLTAERPRHIVAYPAFPSRYSSISTIASHLGLFVTNRLLGHPLAVIHWENATVSRPSVLLQEYAARHNLPVLNARARDISKRAVDECMEATFGYGMRVDPLTWSGPYVNKSDANATHDGRILTAPLRPGEVRPGRMYQILVDNVVQWRGQPMVQDHRIPVCGGAMPCVMLKYRVVRQRFKGYQGVELVEPDDAFSKEELALLRSFCERLGLDHGELDVLRDRQSHRIYVIDANNTPFSPPRGASRSIRRRVTAVSAQAFIDGFGLRV